MHFSIENNNQVVSYELTSKILNHIKLINVVQHLIIVHHYENIIENIINFIQRLLNNRSNRDRIQKFANFHQQFFL